MIVLDTHILLWRELEPERLSARSRLTIESARTDGHEIAISAVTLWEIAQVASRSRIRLLVALAEFLDEIEQNYVVVPLSSAIAAQAVKLVDPFPRDPMDKWIAATALLTHSILITADRKIRAAQVCECSW